MCAVWHYGLTISMYGRGSFIWINWDDERFGYAENPDN